MNSIHSHFLRFLYQMLLHERTALSVCSLCTESMLTYFHMHQNGGKTDIKNYGLIVFSKIFIKKIKTAQSNEAHTSLLPKRNAPEERRSADIPQLPPVKAPKAGNPPSKCHFSRVFCFKRKAMGTDQEITGWLVLIQLWLNSSETILRSQTEEEQGLCSEGPVWFQERNNLPH